MLKAAFVGVAAVLLAILLKGMKSEYPVYISLAALVIIFGVGVGNIRLFTGFIEKIREYTGISEEYIKILLKITGIAYICDLAASICSDAGFTAIAGQIEFIGRISIMATGMPVVFALLDMLNTMLVV